MRDIKRIHRVTSKLEELWYLLPDYRFWQLLSVLQFPKERAGTDPFFWEEDVWETAIDEQLMQMKQQIK